MAKPFKILIILSSFFYTVSALSQQLHKHFELKDAQSIDKVDLQMSTKAGKTFLNAVDSEHPIEILGAGENNVAASSFKMEKMGQTQKVNAKLTCKSHMGINLTEAVAGSFFSSETKNKDLWQLNLSEHIAFQLSLGFMMGDASIDLSRLAIERLKVNSGSADVNLSYSNKSMNSVAMDTFFVKSNFGNVKVADLNCTMAKEIIAEVGFGTISLECGDDWKMNSRISASVGAGNLNIILPPDNIPVIIRINDSPLCNIKMANDFEKIGHNTYGNTAYKLNPDEGLEFWLDVGMGSIVFENQ